MVKRPLRAAALHRPRAPANLVSNRSRDSGGGLLGVQPDIPGVAATGSAQMQCEREMREAIALHLEGLAQDREPVPETHSTASYAVVDLA